MWSTICSFLPSLVFFYEFEWNQIKYNYFGGLLWWVLLGFLWMFFFHTGVFLNARVLLSKHPWNAFDESTGKLPQASFENLPQKFEPVPPQNPSASGDHHQYKNSSEVLLLHYFILFFWHKRMYLYFLKQLQFSLVTLMIYHDTGNWMLCFHMQQWNAFDGSTGSPLQASFVNFQPKSEPLVPAQKPPTSGDHHQYKNSLDVMFLHAFICFLLKILLV